MEDPAEVEPASLDMSEPPKKPDLQFYFSSSALPTSTASLSPEMTDRIALTWRHLLCSTLIDIDEATLALLDFTKKVYLQSVISSFN